MKVLIAAIVRLFPPLQSRCATTSSARSGIISRHQLVFCLTGRKEQNNNPQLTGIACNFHSRFIMSLVAGKGQESEGEPRVARKAKKQGGAGRAAGETRDVWKATRHNKSVAAAARPVCGRQRGQLERRAHLRLQNVLPGGGGE